MAADQQQTLNVEQARQRILAGLECLDACEYLPLRSAFGRILAKDIVATFNVPSADNSAMDGYAINLSAMRGLESHSASKSPDDSAMTMKVIGSAFAGKHFSGRVGAGQTVRIMTGAIIPDGADTVVVQEKVRNADQTSVLISLAGLRVGQNIRRAGEDLAKGSVALTAGTCLGAADLGLLASLGVTEVQVKRKLRVAILSTGDELVPVGKALSGGQVHDSNRYTLFGLLQNLPVDMIDLGLVQDQEDALSEAFAAATAQADVLLTTGGVSVGEADLVRDMLARLGEISFWKLNIKPGRPMAFGYLHKAEKNARLQFFGLPGNPVAAMVCFIVLVESALLKMAGCSKFMPAPLIPMPLQGLSEPWQRQPGRREYLRAQYLQDSHGMQVRLIERQGSGILTSMSQANCFVVVAEDCAQLHNGDTVHVQMLK